MFLHSLVSYVASISDHSHLDGQSVPSRKDVQLMLAEKELLEGSASSGAADWIARGLKLAEAK